MMYVTAALSIIQAVIKLRGQVDTIMSLHKASDPLPFRLPKVNGRKDFPHREAMLAFFGEKDGRGEALLIAAGKHGHFLEFKAATDPDTEPEQTLSNISVGLYTLYYEATGVQPTFVGGTEEPLFESNPETLLAYYSVRSGRLSKNSVTLRLALATADTLLEVAGANAGYFAKNPATQQVIQTLITSFDFDANNTDPDLDIVFKNILVATVAAATETPGLTQDMPALKPLFSALAQVCKDLPTDGQGKNFVAQLVSADGFTRLLTGYLTQVAADPSFISNNAVAQEVLTVTLKELATKAPAIFQDPKTLLGIVDVGMRAAAKHMPELLEKKDIAGKPIVAALLTTLAQEVDKTGDPFFQRLAKGEILPALYKSALEQVAANPSLVVGSAASNAILRELVGGVASAIKELEPAKIFSEETLRALAAKSIETLGQHPELLAGNNAAATATLAIVFKSSAAALKDLRLTHQEIVSLAEASLQIAATHPAVAKFDADFAGILPIISATLLSGNLKTLLTPQAWRETLVGALNAVVAHPAVWKKMRERDLVQPLAEALVGALTQGSSPLLIGPRLPGTLQSLLEAAARHAQPLLEDQIKSADLRAVLVAVIAEVDRTEDLAMDARNLPLLLERALTLYLKVPFASGDAAEIQALVAKATSLLSTQQLS